MHYNSALSRLAVACIVLIAAHLGSIAPASAGTCGVLPFTHGADVTDGAATNITSLVSTELDFRGGWTIVVTASKQEITDGCGADQACLMAFGKGESHDGVVTGTIATEGSDKYRITARWYEVGTGRMKREVSQAINRKADLLIEEVPGLVTELLTGVAPVSADEADEETADDFASLDEIDFDDLDEEEEDEPRVKVKAKPKRDNRGRRREPVEETADPFGLDVDDLDDLEEVERENERERERERARAEREEDERRAREEERRRAERIAEERRAEEEAAEQAREQRRERERRARARAEREREEEERQARAEQRRREREEEERRGRQAREREEERERARAARERREREEAEERDRRAREREEREREARVAQEARSREERREAAEREDRERREQLAEARRLERERERERREADDDDDDTDYAAVELGSALDAGAISFASDDEEEGYVGFVMEDAAEEEDDDGPLISMEPADEDDEDEDDEPEVGDLVTGGGYDDPGARRRANAADRRADRDDRYSRARSFGSSSSDDDDDDDDDDGYRSVGDDEDEDDRLASRDDSVVDRSRSRSRSRSRDDDRDGTYRYRPAGSDEDDLDEDDDRDSYSSRRSTGRASATKRTSDPGARRHISIRGSGGFSHYYLFFGQYGLELGIFPIDALSIDVGGEGWSLSLTEQAEDDAGEPLWDENGEAITTTELRTLPHFSIGASWRGNFHRVIKPYAGGDVGAIMYATEKHSDGSSTPRFGVTGMAKGGADFMITKVIGAHVGVRVGVAYSPLVEELVYFEWNPVTFVFNLKAGLTLAF